MQKIFLSQFNVNKLLKNNIFISLIILLVLNLSLSSSQLGIMKLVTSSNKIGLEFSDTFLESALYILKTIMVLEFTPVVLHAEFFPIKRNKILYLLKHLLSNSGICFLDRIPLMCGQYLLCHKISFSEAIYR